MSKDTKKETRGGARTGSGRKPRDPIHGARVKANFTLRPDHYENIVGKDVGAYLDAGLEIVQFALGHTPGTDACLIAYYAITEAIQRLERRRDYHPETGELNMEEFFWTPQEAQLHTLLNEFWDRIRREPLFTEPKLPL